MRIKYAIQMLLLLQVVSPVCNGWAAETDSAIEGRMQYISKLINSSSGAKLVINSGNQEAIDQRTEALALYQKAEGMMNVGKTEEALQLLDQSAKMMFSAIRKAAPAKMAIDKNTRDYVARRESVDSLLQAFQRIVKEEGAVQHKEKVNRQIALLIDSGDDLLKNGHYLQARTEIDKAYHLLKVSIESIRGGQTLVRSLRFKTSEEEYRYELDRNETHRMLISLLIKEKEKSEHIRKQLLIFIDEAKAFRREAESLASQEEFERAIEMLEKSTRQLVRAIRSAGIYIPG